MAKKQYFIESELVFRIKPNNSRFEDLSLQEFNKLTVLGFAGKRLWFCKCRCGKITKVYAGDLKSGGTISCGCFQVEVLSKRNIMHGHAGRGMESSTYFSWQSMLKRCLNPNSKQFQDYGGRGIAVCEDWKESFNNFLADMGEKPKGMTIERNDVNGNYCPENCRWATPKEQANNRRSNVVLTYDGVSKNITQWADGIGLKSGALWARINKYGWPIELALTTPKKRSYQ